jgi:hypothetical protein
VQRWNNITTSNKIEKILLNYLMQTDAKEELRRNEAAANQGGHSECAVQADVPIRLQLFEYL